MGTQIQILRLFTVIQVTWLTGMQGVGVLKLLYSPSGVERRKFPSAHPGHIPATGPWLLHNKLSID